MKKLTLFTALAVLFTAVFSVAAPAAAVVPDEPEPVVIDVIGEPEEIPDRQEIALSPGYELVAGDEVLLTVERTERPSVTSGVPEHRYTVDFVIPGTEKRVYLVGLDEDKVVEIQVKLLLSFSEGADFDLEDLSFIDAEKTYDKDMDDELCWAAGAANILTYTGWAAAAGFETADDVFEAFVDAYDNKPGNTYYGIAWFFNGVNDFAVRTPSASSAAEGTGGYIRDYAVEQVASYVNVTAAGTDGMSTLLSRLEEGWGASLSVSLYTDGHYSGGHTLTCFGFVEDTAYEADDPLRYAGLLLTDSDSDELSGSNRRLSPNVLHAVSLSPCTEPEKYDSFSFRHGNYDVVIDECEYLMPYGEELPKETAVDATRDKVNTPDLYIKGMYLGVDTENPETLLDTLESGVDFFYTPIIVNMADVSYEDAMRIAITVENAEGDVAFTRSVKSSVITIKPEKSASYGTKLSRSGGLPEGDYTIRFTLNAAHDTAEAFYYNNSFSYDFKVRDSYLLGDVSNNGVVDIMDATLIQRMLARFEDDLPARAEQRAMICGDEITIMDATQIQRHLADYDTGRPIGEKRLYD